MADVGFDLECVCEECGSDLTIVWEYVPPRPGPSMAPTLIVKIGSCHKCTQAAENAGYQRALDEEGN